MLALPRLTGIFLISLPSWKTDICFVALSMSSETCRPILETEVWSASPTASLPIGSPSSPVRTLILVPGFQ